MKVFRNLATTACLITRILNTRKYGTLTVALSKASFDSVGVVMFCAKTRLVDAKVATATKVENEICILMLKC